MLELHSASHKRNKHIKSHWKLISYLIAIPHLVSLEVLEIYMHQFWTTIKKIGDLDAYNFKLEKKKLRVHTKVFHEILQICPRILNQDFIAPPLEEDLVTFIQEVGYSGRCNMLPEDFMYQVDNRDISSARKEHMPYPRFTKVIINHFISKEKTISMRNRINLHTICDDSLLGTLKFISKTQDYQQYGALIPDDMINQDIKDFNAYKTYYDFATGKVPPRKARRYKKVASPPRKLSPVKEAEPVKKGKRVKRPAKKSTTAPTTGVVLRDTPGVSVSKNKAPAKGGRSKGIEILSDVALSEAAQLKEATKRSKKYFHISQASGSGDGTDLISGVPDEKQRKTSSTDEGTNDNDDDSDDNNKGDDDKADSNDDEHDDEYESDDDNENVFEEEEDDDLYKDVDVRSLGTEHEKERQGDEEMTDSDQNVSQELPYDKFLILKNVPPSVDEVASMMNVKSRREESSTQAPSLFTVPVTAIP
ncbi:hypothetical protein Tco_0637645 [Tanacetum coccineum]